MNEKEYNGWTNYETWLVALWLGNDQGTYDDVRQLTKDTIEATGKACEWQLARSLRDYVESILPDLDASLAADLMGASLSEVNWQEIAESYISEIGAEDD